MRKIKWCLLLPLLLILAVLLDFIGIVKNVSAFNELSISVGLIASADNIGFSGAYGDSCPVNLNDGYYINQQTSNYCGITGMIFGNLQNSLGWGIGNGNYLKVYFYGYELRDKEDFHSVQNNGFQGSIIVNGTTYTLQNVGFNGVLTSQNSALYEYIFKYDGSAGTIQQITLKPGVALAPNELYRMGGINLYGVAGAGADYSSDFDDLIRQNEAIINKLGISNGNEQTIINALNNLPSSTGIKNAIEDAKEDEKEEIQDASDEGADEADDANAEAEQNTQSLLTTAGSIIDVFRNAQPSDCLIRLNMGNNRLDTGTIDLCNAPTEMRNIITTILAIPITIGVLHITHSLIMIYIERIREEQE